MGTSSRTSLAPGKAPKENAPRNVSCCLTPEKGAAKWDFCQCTPCREGLATPCATHAGHCSRDGNSPASPLLQGKHSKACTCSVVLLPLWESPSERMLCCISATGTATKIVPKSTGTLFLPFLVPSFFCSRQEFGSEQAHCLLQTGTVNEITSSPPQNNLVEHRLIHLSEVTCWLLPKIACKGLKSAVGTLVPNTPEAPRGCPGPAALGSAPLSPCRQGWAVPLFHSVSPVAKHTPHSIYTAGIHTVFIHRWTKQTDPPFSIKSSF